MKFAAYLPHDSTILGVYEEYASGQRRVLGSACFHPSFGWRFATGERGRRSSTKWHATLDRCLPHWLTRGSLVTEYYLYRGKRVEPGFRAPAPTLGQEG